LTDAEENLLRAENDRDERERDLQIAILEYLLATGQLRVDREGQFQPLPGMAQRPAGPDDAGQTAQPDQQGTQEPPAQEQDAPGQAEGQDRAPSQQSRNEPARHDQQQQAGSPRR
ncbi:MAG: hypothetical protein D6824_03195, partial [Planctomycetota bacterium]